MKHYHGQVEVICGSMFCGKTEELIRRVRRAVIARQQTQVFKPAIDDRYSVEHVSSHSGQKIEAELINSPEEIRQLLREGTTVVAIDEAQFFDSTIIDVIEELANKDIRVIVAGLDMDFRGEPFGPMPQILCMAEEVTKLNAICVVCGEAASRTQRLVNNKPARYDDPIIQVGAMESYEPRCRKHHIVLK
mgnify:CR=1 FL=1